MRVPIIRALSGIVALILLLPPAGCGRRPSTPAGAPVAAPAGLFQDVGAQAGISFRFDNGARGRHRFLETVGSGCAFFDYDGDGFPDLLFLQAGPLPGSRSPSAEPRNRLYRNTGRGTFTDVTAGSGLEDTGYSQGVAVGDVNRDGFDDLFITAYGGNHLFLNQGGSGKFRDVTRTAGLSDTGSGPRWCTSAAFGDYDNDGRLDLYVCRYAKWSIANDLPCKNPLGASSYCSPELYVAEEHALYRNNGDGTFSDVTARTGIGGHRGRGLGVAWLDYNRDGWEDIFVANDLSPFFLWRNNGNGTFTDVGTAAGVAYSDQGQLLSGMGVAVRDFDGDGSEDLFVTNFSGQMNALFRNEGKGTFANATLSSGVGSASYTRLAFGCETLDYDRDGLPDILVGNGHVNDDIEAYTQGVTYAQPKSLLRNNGNGTFTDVKEALGSLAVPRVTRGLAVADYDADGSLDAVANNQDGAPELLRYTGASAGHWISLETHGTKSNPDGYHARIVVRAGGATRAAEVRSGSSFCSHSSRSVYYGLGAASTVDELRIEWHGSHTVTSVRNLTADTAYRVVEGGGATPIRRGSR